MNKKDIVEVLSSNLSKIADVSLYPSSHREKESFWSQRFECEEGKELDTLVNIFGLSRNSRLEDLFKSAISGDGDELSKILTLHSSSLLAFLCFSQINKDRPIEICGSKYVEVMFEVKNDVIHPSLGKPSNIDVMLLNDERSEILLIESKFTEYLEGGRVYLSPDRYKPFFSHLLQSKNFNFKASNIEVHHKLNVEYPEGYTTSEYCLHQGSRTTDYLGGIKQAFSHLLGMATGPAQMQADANNHYAEIYYNARKITFATILYNCDDAKLEAYSKLYNSVFRHDRIIKESIKKAVPQSNYIDKLTIHPTIITYQDYFSGYPLPQKVREFYNFNHESQL